MRISSHVRNVIETHEVLHRFLPDLRNSKCVLTGTFMSWYSLVTMSKFEPPRTVKTVLKHSRYPSSLVSQLLPWLREFKQIHCQEKRLSYIFSGFQMR